MKRCWNDDKELRPNFYQLRMEFDDIISLEDKYKYLPLRAAPVREDLAPVVDSRVH